MRQSEDEPVVRQLLQWHAYARRRGLELDLVILDERIGEIVERLRAELQNGVVGAMLGKPGGVFLLSAEKLSGDDTSLFAAAARVVLGGGQGTLAKQLDQHHSDGPGLPPPLMVRPLPQDPVTRSAQPRRIAILERLRRIHLRRSRIRHRDRQRRLWWTGLAAGPLDQCARQSGIRVLGHRSRTRLQLGGQ